MSAREAARQRTLRECGPWKALSAREHALNSELGSAFAAARQKDPLTRGGFGPAQESVGFRTLAFLRLVGPFGGHSLS